MELPVQKNNDKVITDPNAPLSGRMVILVSG